MTASYCGGLLHGGACGADSLNQQGRHQLDDLHVFDLAVRDRGQARLQRDGIAPAVRGPRQRAGPLGHLIAEVTSAVHEIVELEVERPKMRADDVPVQLLAGQAEVGQIDEHRLQCGAERVALLVAKGGVMVVRGYGHGRLLGRGSRFT